MADAPISGSELLRIQRICDLFDHMRAEGVDLIVYAGTDGMHLRNFNGSNDLVPWADVDSGAANQLVLVANKLTP